MHASRHLTATLIGGGPRRRPVVLAFALGALSILCLPAGATIRMSSQPIWQRAGSYPTGLGWADFDANGWMDLAVTHGLDVTNSPNFVYFNQDGQLSTSPGWTSTDSRTSNCMFIGDLDNDGDPDVAVATLGLITQNLAPEPHVVYYNAGGLEPSPGWLSPPGNAFACAGGDPDGDGDLDLVFPEGHWLDGGLKTSKMFLNNGGVFDTVPGWETADLHYGCAAVFGDVDRDGDLDLAIGWGDSTGIAVFMNHGGVLETTPTWTTAAVSGGLQMNFGDMDGDGFLDLAVADVPRGFHVFKNTAGVLDSVPTWSYRTQAQASAVAWADLDGDGDLDLATGSWSGPAFIFENIGGMLAEQPSWSHSCTGAQQIAFADFDEDSLFTTREAFVADGRRLFYVSHAPMHELLAIELNGTELTPAQFCYDPLCGWVSLGVPASPGDTVAVTYVYSLDLDLAITEWSYTKVFRNESLHPPYVVPDMHAEPSTGHAPLSVQFTDLSESIPAAIAWAWDFDNDGTVDSRERHPAWTYVLPGSYNVSLTVDNGSVSETVVRESFVSVFDGESALSFDGSSGGVECAASPSLALTDAATVEAWICPEGWGEVQNSGAGRIVDKSATALYLNGTGNAYASHSLVLLLRNTSGPPRVCCTPDSSIVLGNWHHVAATYDGATGSVRMYINGLEQPLTLSSQPSGPIRDNATEALFIGNGSAQNYTFDGAIDEVRVWNTVRSATEISAAMGVYLGGSELGLVGYWRMNEGNGTAIDDWSPHGNNGELIAGTWVAGTPFVPSVSGEEKWDDAALPARFTLSPPCPNPTTGRTALRYAVPDMGEVRVEIYDLDGRLLKTLTSGPQSVGVHTVVWDGADAQGRGVASGLYFAHMTAGSFSTSRPCVVIR
ncbi:VCBS repeat-containing protein [Candidatus Fermentibacteria bacterium]|nr:VCBS repeat-containing protein [Candidatus Fermentibacteria bacterium]